MTQIICPVTSLIDGLMVIGGLFAIFCFVMAALAYAEVRKEPRGNGLECPYVKPQKR